MKYYVCSFRTSGRMIQLNWILEFLNYKCPIIDSVHVFRFRTSDKLHCSTILHSQMTSIFQRCFCEVVSCFWLGEEVATFQAAVQIRHNNNVTRFYGSSIVFSDNSSRAVVIYEWRLEGGSLNLFNARNITFYHFYRTIIIVNITGFSHRQFSQIFQ